MISFFFKVTSLSADLSKYLFSTYYVLAVFLVIKATVVSINTASAVVVFIAFGGSYRQVNRSL